MNVTIEKKTKGGAFKKWWWRCNIGVTYTWEAKGLKPCTAKGLLKNV